MWTGRVYGPLKRGVGHLSLQRPVLSDGGKLPYLCSTDFEGGVPILQFGLRRL